MWPIEKRCARRDVTAFVVPETVDLLAEKMVGIIADRRVTKMHRYLGEAAGVPRLYPGLRLNHCGLRDAVVIRQGQSISVALASQSHLFEGAAFGVGPHHETEARAADRYRHPETQWLGQRRDVTLVEMDGWPGQPAPGDHIRIEDWNEHGVGQETLLVFDDVDPVEEIAWEIKGDRERRVHLWDEFCDEHALHFEHPDHKRLGCKGRQSTRAEDLAVLAHLAQLKDGS